MACANSAPRPASGQARFFAQVDLAVILADLPATAKEVYTLLERYRNAQNGYAWPGRDTIAAMLKIHPDSVSRCTRQLEAAGFITITHGPGNRCYYGFPWVDARLADQRAKRAGVAPASPASAVPEKPPRKPRQRLPAETLPGAGSDPAVRTSRARTSIADGDAKKNPPQTPPLDPAPAEPEAPRGESFATHSPDLETLSADLADNASALGSQQQTEPSQQGAPEARRSPEPSKPAPSHRLAFPDGLPALLCVQLGRMLASTPEAIAQEILDEMAFNARCHGINSPGGYVRRLLNLYQRGEFSPEVAHFERERRERIAANERARKLVERRHLEALAQGQLPASPPIVINRTPEDEERAWAALADMRRGLGMKPSPYGKTAT